AHDFNNILTLIQGYSSLLLDEENLNQEFTDSLQQISAASQRASNLTRQLLMFGRKQVMQLQDLDMNEVISNVTKLLRRILGEDIALHFNYSPNLPKVHADSGMMEQVLMNLAVNARDAMPRGGQLTIGTNVVEINSTHVRANPEVRAGQFICLRVSDSGTGIPRDIVSKIFEPFFTTKEVGKGTGLGLATVYGIAKQHQGWIEVLSEIKKGTTFLIFLPINEHPAPGVEAEPPREKVCGGSEKILIVEDEPELRTLVAGILESYGYQVFQAASGPEALPVWSKNSSQIDLLLTDLVMPGNMTGRELAQKLKMEKPSLKVIYTSGYSMETLGKDFVFKRGLNFLPKPYHPLTLVKIVRDCLDS
ncbi:MAG: ATP-binding protein, partial [Limisphaerales bacterium]